MSKQRSPRPERSAINGFSPLSVQIPAASGVLAMQDDQLFNQNTMNETNMPFEVGKKYFVRTATYHVVGEIEKVVGNFIVWKEDTISWIADSGRFMQAINDGNLDEVEPVKVSGGTNILGIIDYFEWTHELPRSQK